MTHHYEITFKKNSRLAQVGSSFYTKEDIFSLIKKMKQKGKVSYSNEEVRGDHVHFYYTIRDKKEISRIHIQMSKTDFYVLDFVELYDVKRILSVVKEKLILFFSFLGIVVGISSFSNFQSREELPFAKTFIENDVSDLDHMIETYLEKEKNLSISELKLLESFKHEKWLTEGKYILDENVPYIEAFGIKESLPDVIAEISKNDSMNHTVDIDYYYDSENDNFNKERILEKIKENSNLKVLDTSYTCLTDEELSIVVNQLYSFIEKTKELDKDFDVRHFVCALIDTTFFKNSDYEFKNRYIFAFTTDDHKIVWNTFQEKMGDFNESIQINYHEYSHLEQFSCTCETEKSYIVNGNSVICGESVSNEMMTYTQPYYNRFLGEVSAERISSLFQNEEISSYFGEDFVTTNLELALSVHPDYQMGSFIHTAINRDPISFYQTFPYLYDEEEELSEYLAMLLCYDFSLFRDERLGESCPLTIDGKNLDQLSPNLRYYAEVKHVELFYKNLFYLNENSDEDLLTYNIFLIQLFETMMHKQDCRVFITDEEQILGILEDARNHFFSYLKEKYPDQDIETLYYSSEDLTLDEFPSFVDEDKKAFYVRLYYDQYFYLSTLMSHEEGLPFVKK